MTKKFIGWLWFWIGVVAGAPTGSGPWNVAYITVFLTTVLFAVVVLRGISRREAEIAAKHKLEDRADE